MSSALTLLIKISYPLGGVVLKDLHPLEMLHRCFRNGIDARFVLFDSWFANNGLLANIVEIGYGGICRLKATKTRYTYQGKAWTPKELWHEVARHRLQVVPGWNLKAAVLNVNLPVSGTVRLVFVRWTKKQWHFFLCTEIDLEPEEILNYYARRWAIEVYFPDAKQMLALGQGQSECFDALIDWTSIVMIPYLLLVYMLARKQGMSSSIGPPFEQVAQRGVEDLHDASSADCMDRGEIANSPMDSWTKLALGDFRRKLRSCCVTTWAFQFMATVLVHYRFDLRELKSLVSLGIRSLFTAFRVQRGTALCAGTRIMVKNFIYFLNGQQFPFVSFVPFLAACRPFGLLLFWFRHLRTIRRGWLGGVG